MTSVHADILPINSEQLIEYIEKNSHDKPVVVSLTSTQKACIHCIPYNEKIINAEIEHREDFTFVQLNFNPWLSFQKDKALVEKYKKERIRLTGLPQTNVFYKGMNFKDVRGNDKYLALHIKAAKTLVDIHDTEEYDGKPVPVVKADELDAFIESHKGSDRMLLVHLTSTDGSSPHTKRNNSYIRLAQRRFEKHMDFVEVHFNPWNTVSELKKVAKFNQAASQQVNGIPYDYLITRDGNVYGLGGTMPTLSDNLKLILDDDKKKKNAEKKKAE